MKSAAVVACGHLSLRTPIGQLLRLANLHAIEITAGTVTEPVDL